MFSTIFKHELRFWLTQWTPYVFAIFLFTVSLISMWGMASEGTEGADLVIQNSYSRLNYLTVFISQIMLFIIPAITGLSVYRDYQSRIYNIIYTYPFTKLDYLLAKFFSSFCVVLFIIGMVLFGFAIGTIMPGVNPRMLLSFNPLSYLQVFIVYIIPNMFLYSIIVFAVVLFTRNIFIGFISLILFLVLKSISISILAGSPIEWVQSLADPTGESVVKNIVRYWTLEERNINVLPIDFSVIFNRFFWLSVASVIAGYTYKRFNFNHQPVSIFKRKAKIQRTSSSPKDKNLSVLVHYNFNFKSQLYTAWKISQIELMRIIKSWAFLAILIAGFIMVYFQQSQMASSTGVEMLPTTAQMLRIPMFVFSATINLLTFLYAGLLIYQAKINRMDSLIDSTAQADWVLLLSKLLALLKMQLILLAMVLLAGLIAQTIQGYYQYDIAHYLFELFVLQFLHFLVWACLAISVHTLSKNLYLGFFLLILIPLGFVLLPSVGEMLNVEFLQEGILQFNQIPGQFVGFEYSDFNGYGSILPTVFIYTSYWIMWALLLVLIALAFWQRGIVFSFYDRVQKAKQKLHGLFRIAIFTTPVLIIFIACNIYYQEHHVSKFDFNQSKMEQISIHNEKQFGHFSHLLQPQIVKTVIDMDIYPESRDYMAQGYMYFVNKHDTMIDTVLVATSFKDSTSVTLHYPSELLVQDPLLHYHLYRLTTPLNPGDSIKLEVQIQNYPNSLLHDNSRVLSNGTYITGSILPVLGIRNAFVTNAKKRQEFGLQGAAISITSHLDSLELLGDKNPNNNMERIEFETNVSTSADQQAFAMGRLISQDKIGDRNIYHYKSDGKITNTVSWLSGQYEIKKDTVLDTEISIYHHPNHNHNYQDIMAGIKTSIEYNSSLFGPLQHKTLKVIEFPMNYGTHATLNGNLIPYSESQFLASNAVLESINASYPYYTSIHEVSHYWWGHQVDPANIPGGKMLTESIAEYLSHQMIEQEFGKESVRSLRSKYRDLYLKMRTNSSSEVPLHTCGEEQDYISYQKGALQLSAMAEYLGKSKLNSILADFLYENKFTEAPYSSAIGVLDRIKNNTPDSLQYLVKDLFQTISFYDISIVDVAVQSRIDKKFDVALNLRISKYRSDRKGKRTFSDNGLDSLKTSTSASLPLVDYIRISVETANGIESVHTIKATEIDTQIKLQSSEYPMKITIDPDLILMDIDQKDNVWEKKYLGQE